MRPSCVFELQKVGYSKICAKHVNKRVFLLVVEVKNKEGIIGCTQLIKEIQIRRNDYEGNLSVLMRNA